MKPRIFATALLLGAAVIGSGNALAHDDDGRCGNCGTVVGVSEVTKKDTHLGAGTAIGAVAGGVLGNQVGKGDGRKAATVAGAVAGGAIGHSVEKNNRETRAAGASPSTWTTDAKSPSRRTTIRTSAAAIESEYTTDDWNASDGRTRRLVSRRDGTTTISASAATNVQPRARRRDLCRRD